MGPGHGRPLLVALTIATFATSVATASAVTVDTSITESAGVDLPSVSVPDVPQVDVPDLPQLPSTPSLPDVPSLPSAPSVPDAGGDLLRSAPSLAPSEDGTGAAPSGSESSGASVAPTPSGSSTSTSADSSSQSGAASDADVQSPGEQRIARRAERFEEAVQKLRGCLAALPALEWQVASLRAGVPVGRPMSQARVARQLDISLERVRELERSALESLQASARSDRCGRSGAGAFGVAPPTMSASLETIPAPGVVGGLAFALTEPDDERASRDRDDDASGTSTVAEVFGSGSSVAGVGGSLLAEDPSVSALAVGFGSLLLLAAVVHVYRRRAF